MSRSRDIYGQVAIDEFFLQGITWYRQHLELAVPFIVAGAFALLFELRLETVELLYTDRDAIDAILTERAAAQLGAMADEIFWLLILGTVGLALLAALLVLVAVGFAFLVAADEYHGRERLGTARFRVVLGRLPALCVATTLAGLLVGAGLLLLVIPGLYLAVKFALGGPAILTEGYGPIEGLKASWRAVAGNFVEVAGILVLGGVTFIVVALLPLIGELLAVVVVLPIFSLALAAIYLDAVSADRESGL